MKKLAALVTLLLLVVLYAQMDRQALLQHFRSMRLDIFGLALLCFVPQILVTTWRWCLMVRDVCPMPFGDAMRLILASRALNAFLPSKLGEASKAYFVHTQAHLPLAQGVALVLLEKVLDVAGLGSVLLTGVALLPHRGALEITAALLGLCPIGLLLGIVLCRTTGFRRLLRPSSAWQRRLGSWLEAWDGILLRWWQQPRRLAGITGLSSVLWFLHLGQIYLFFVALQSTISAALVLAYVPLSIAVGILPVTLGGMGTRDTALIVLFAPYETTTMMAGIGVLCSMRYWADTVLGLPFFQRYAFDTKEKHTDTCHTPPHSALPSSSTIAPTTLEKSGG